MSDKQVFNHTSSEADQDEEALQDDLFAALDEAEEEPEAQPQPSADVQTEEAPALLPSLEVRAPYALPVAPQLEFTPRPYQQSAVDAWLRDGGRGVVVLPTGAGKTVVAFDAIARLAVRTLVIVPTIELLRQWRSGHRRTPALPRSAVGAVGGGERTHRPDHRHHLRFRRYAPAQARWLRLADLRRGASLARAELSQPSSQRPTRPGGWD